MGCKEKKPWAEMDLRERVEHTRFYEVDLSRTDIDVNDPDFEVKRVNPGKEHGDHGVQAYYKGEPIGFIDIDVLDPTAFYLGMVGVDAEYWGNGVFGAMYKEALRLMKDEVGDGRRFDVNAHVMGRSREFLTPAFQKRGYRLIPQGVCDDLRRTVHKVY